MPKLLLPLVALLAVGGSVAGAGVYLATRGETVEEVQPSPVAEATPTPTATAAPSPTPTATALTGGKAPDACLDKELAYVDPAGRFAFCYPTEMATFTVPTSGDLLAVTVQHPISDANRVTITFGYETVPYSPCVEDPRLIKNQRFEALIVDGQTVQACFQDVYDPAQPDVWLLTTVDFRVATTSGKFVQVLVVYGPPQGVRDGVPVEEVAGRVLDSAVIY